MSYLIKLESVCKHYAMGDETVHALRGVDFGLQRGELTAIVGESGSGKSTLMNIVGLLDKPSSGRYHLVDKDVSDLSDAEISYIRSREIGFVFQSFFLLPRLTAIENVALPLMYRDVPVAEAHEKAMHVLERIQVPQLAKKKPNQMSGGQQQRIAIARALVGDPGVVLADEPTGALDSETSRQIMDLFIELNEKEDRTILIITHSHRVSEHCRRVVTLKDGLIESDTVL